MNQYNIFCDNCHFKKHIKSPEDLKGFRIIKSAPVQKNLPTLDQLTNKVKVSIDKELPKKIRCPKCGFAIRPKLIKENQDDKSNK